MHKDIERLKNKYNNYYYQEKLINKIEKDIMNLLYMPRIHKTLICSNDKDGEYRRMVSGRYSIIYKIVEDEIIILRIFNQRENYLNSKSFIIKEESQKYVISKRRKIKMVKFRTLKNSYLKLKEKYIHVITPEERYINMLIDEVESESEEERVYYTPEEFWKLVEEMEIERYGHPI